MPRAPVLRQVPREHKAMQGSGSVPAAIGASSCSSLSRCCPRPAEELLRGQLPAAVARGRLAEPAAKDSATSVPSLSPPQHTKPPEPYLCPTARGLRAGLPAWHRPRTPGGCRGKARCRLCWFARLSSETCGQNLPRKRQLEVGGCQGHAGLGGTLTTTHPAPAQLPAVLRSRCLE